MKNALKSFVFTVMMSIILGASAQAPEIIDLEVDTELEISLVVYEIDGRLFFTLGNRRDSLPLLQYNQIDRGFIVWSEADHSLTRFMLPALDTGYRYRCYPYIQKNADNDYVVVALSSPCKSYDPFYDVQAKDVRIHCFKLDENFQIFEEKCYRVDRETDNLELFFYSYPYSYNNLFLPDKDNTLVVQWIMDDLISHHISFLRLDLNTGDTLYRKKYYNVFSHKTDSLYIEHLAGMALLHNQDSTEYYYFYNTQRQTMDKNFELTGEIKYMSYPYTSPGFSSWDKNGYFMAKDGSLYIVGHEEATYGYPKRTTFIAKINDSLRLEKSFSGQEPIYDCDYPAWYHSVDFIGENRIIFGCHLGWNTYDPQTHTYWILYCFDHELNVIQEYYYHHEGNPEQQFNDLKATADGGCILVGGYRREMTSYNNLVLKFPPEAFVGIEEAHESGLSVAIAYPNPDGDKMCIRTAVPNAEVEVFDINGRMVAKQQLQDKETVLNATAWQSGTYLWRVYSEGKMVETGKWVRL